MTCEAIRRRLLFAMTRDADTHVQIDVSLRDGLLSDVAVTGRAFDFRADVRRMIELDVRLRRVIKHALPGEIDAFFPHRRNLLDTRPIGGNRVVADHARPHTRQTCNRPRRHRLVTILGAGDLFADVDVVRELDRLHGFRIAAGSAAQKRSFSGAPKFQC